jgi:hypothetical protein
MKFPKIRSRWVGWKPPAFERDCSPLEKWAVYVVQIPGVNKPTWAVVGRLMQRPWSRVGGRNSFGSLGKAREDGQRMADVICPRDQARINK